MRRHSQSPPQPAQPRPGTDRLLLAAVALVVMLVSLPRLQNITLRSNELDACATLRLLGQSVLAAEGERTGVPLSLAIENSDELAHRLQDAREERGAVLSYHGYLFDLETAPGAEPALVAWPRKAGHTGKRVYRWSPDRKLCFHANENRSFSGLERSPAGVLPASAWERVEDASR